MRLSDFDYHLPADRIAQQPADRRDGSRLLVVERSAGPLRHLVFGEIFNLLRQGDVLVLNNTRVIPARLFGRKQTGGMVELLLDRPLGQEREQDGVFCQEWACLVRASRPLRDGARVFLADGFEAESLGRTPDAGCRVLLRLGRPVMQYLMSHGRVPLPAYIRRDEQGDPRDPMDRERYQTVYAREDGAVAAPTAGLHLTEDLLEDMRARGVEIVQLTLHVGPGTFLPVRCDDVDRHEMHAERYEIPRESAVAIRSARRDARRVVAVGTTVVRALEGAWDPETGGPRPGTGLTDLFIRPGHRFQAVDALLTNFHLPRSTLLMLVCAFAGRERVLDAYRQAVEAGYRFYSYGDAMFLA